MEKEARGEGGTYHGGHPRRSRNIQTGQQGGRLVSAPGWKRDTLPRAPRRDHGKAGNQGLCGPSLCLPLVNPNPHPTPPRGQAGMMELLHSALTSPALPACSWCPRGSEEQECCPDSPTPSTWPWLRTIEMSGITPSLLQPKPASCWASRMGRQPQLCSAHQHLHHEPWLFGEPKLMVLQTDGPPLSAKGSMK